MQVRFRLKQCQTKFGEGVFVVGSVPELSNWSPRGGVALTTSKAQYPLWESAGVEGLWEGAVEYKYIVKQVSKRLIANIA